MATAAAPASMAAEYAAAATREVVRTITEKCEVLGKMLETSRVKLRSAQDIAQDAVFQHMPLLHEMNSVFEQLRTATVEPAATRGERGKSLFDFIDAETVQSLQQEALDQAKEIEDLLAAHEHAIVRIEVVYKFFVSFQMTYAAELDDLAAHRPDSDQDPRQIGAFYDVAVNFFVDMEQCDRLLLRHFTTINDIHPHYEIVFAEVQLLFDELRSLRDFYLQFLASYRQVGPELARRRRYELHIAQTIQEMRTKLAKLEDQETQQRLAFCDDHERFMPSTLCPEIKELPRRFDIVATDSDLVASDEHEYDGSHSAGVS